MSDLISSHGRYNRDLAKHYLQQAREARLAGYHHRAVDMLDEARFARLTAFDDWLDQGRQIQGRIYWEGPPPTGEDLVAIDTLVRAAYAMATERGGATPNTTGLLTPPEERAHG